MVDLHHSFRESQGFFLVAGPCVVESEENVMTIAKEVNDICQSLNIPYIFKASYKKANRSSIQSFTGIGDEEALKLIAKVKEKLDIPVTTDIHTEAEASYAANFVDILQIPAFLCRQTDLLLAAAKTGRWVNIKKGQFMAPEGMSFAVNKVKSIGNEQVLLTERGTTFGYQDLVVDYRAIPIMQQYAPVVMDCTHSLQKPNQEAGITSGTPQYISTIAKAAIATGANGLFIETHPNPSKALSDGANMLPLDQLGDLLLVLSKIKSALR